MSIFQLNDEQLKIILDSYSKYLSKHEENVDYIKTLGETALYVQRSFIDLNKLRKDNDKTLHENLMTYTRKLEGPKIIYGEERLKSFSPYFRGAMNYLASSKDSVEDKVFNLVDDNGKYRFDKIQKQFWSPIISALDSSKYPHWNNKTERALKELGLKISSKLHAGEIYGLIIKAFNKLKSLNSKIDLFGLNHFMHYLTSIDEGVFLLKKIKGMERIGEKMPNELNDLFTKYQKDGRIEFITFHPSYSYEEFIEGITVETVSTESSSGLKYILKAGKFKNLCKKALELATGEEKNDWKDAYDAYVENFSNDKTFFSNAPKVVLIIDEINRGDISKIFGELITLLESDKRLGAQNQIVLKLPYSNDDFGVPPNLYVIGTMNTADRSIALLDVALRRRFGFVEMPPCFDVLEDEHIDNDKNVFEDGVVKLLKLSKDALEVINIKLCKDMAIGRDKQIGHSFLFNVLKISDVILVWKYELLPLLEEYCYSDYSKINKMLFGTDKDTVWITQSKGIEEIKTDNIDDMLNKIISNNKND